MSSSLGIRISFLVLLLALSLGWKLAARPGGPVAEPDFLNEIADFLRRQRLVVTVADKIEDGQPLLRATAGSCRLLVARSPAMGWDRDLIRRHAAPSDEVFVVYRGRVYPEQPTVLTVSDFLWSRLRRELGMSSRSFPVLAIIATKACGASNMPWAETG